MRLPPPGRRRDLVLALLLAAAAAAFRLPRLGIPHQEIFDEVYHAKTALQFLQGVPPVDWVHPPVAKLLIAVGIALFGYHPWSFRLMPALAGIALAPVFFFLARRVLGTERGALLASILFLTDGVYLVQSRVAMTNIFAVLFQVSALLLVLRGAMRESFPVAEAVGGGVALGLALATRWTSLLAACFLALVLLGVRRRRLLRPRELLLVVACLGLLPVALYVGSYLVPASPAPWMTSRPTLAQIVDLQRSIYDYHRDLTAQHPYFSKWYTWPWLYRPTWYYFDDSGGLVRGVVALGNPALWWASVPVTLWALAVGVRKREPRLLFGAFGFLLLYLPWAFSPRKLNYCHYLFEAIPYACLSLGALLDRHWTGARSGLARGYLVFSVVLFLFFFPLLTAIPIPASAFFHQLVRGVRPWTWLPTWV